MRRQTDTRLLLILGFTLIASACGSDEPETKAVATAGAAAAEGEVCAEHGVLEAICTKCNPKLIPVFKAKGDWCDEHGFPESVCPICHPEKGGRPAAEVASDDAPPDGTKVRLKAADTARLAGIETVKAAEQPGGARLEVVAMIDYDATRRAEINARAVGVVRALHVDIGDAVDKGARLATIESASVGEDRSRLRAADARVKAAQASYDREKGLYDKGLSAAKDVAVAEQDLAVARADRGAASTALGMVGGGAGASSYVLSAPIAGTVTQRTATIGHMVGLDEALFEVVDTTRMRADLDIPETELGAIRPGQDVLIQVEGLGEAEFQGQIDYVAPAIDPATRTAKARVILMNPEGVLRANMYGKGVVSLGAARTTVTVPPGAIQRVGDVELCFVRLAEGEYETRRVKSGLSTAASTEIISGLKAGEDVVTKGSFVLKTETLKGSIGAGCCD
jgi:cobalt-zinc-cadmium efflux system membrane fusion protein